MSKPEVELRVPADGAYAALLRTSTAGLAARLDFTLDEIEDARIAVGEATAILLEAALPDADLLACFWLSPGRLRITVSVPTSARSTPETDSFAWMVLTTMAEASAHLSEGHLALTLVATSRLRSQPPG